MRSTVPRGRAPAAIGKAFHLDGFLYSRCVIVANGREFYEAVLANPPMMPRDLEFEALLYIAPRAWEIQTDRERDGETLVSYETYSNADQWRGRPSPARPRSPRRSRRGR